MKLFCFGLILFCLSNSVVNGQDLNGSLVEFDSLIAESIEEKAYQQALDYANQKVSKIKKENLHDSSLVNGLEDMAVCYQYLGNNNKSIALYQQATDLQQKTFGANTVEYAQILGDFATIYKNANRLEQAGESYEEAIQHYKNSRAKKNKNYIKWCNALAGVNRDLGNYDKAEQGFKEALVLSRQLFGEKHDSYIYSLNFLGHLYYLTSRYKEAEKTWQKAMKLSIQLYGKKEENYSHISNFLANLYTKWGQYKKAETLQTETLMLRKKLLGENHNDYAQSLNNLSVLYERQGRYEEAEAAMLEAIEIRDKLGRTTRNATELNNLATLYYMMDKHNEAKAFYLESIAIEKRLGREKTLNYLMTLGSLASLYGTLNELDKAKDLLQTCLETKEELLGRNNTTYALSVHNLANLYVIEKEYKKAETLFLEAQEILNTVDKSKTQKLYVVNMHNLASLYVVMNKAEKAEKLYLEAREIGIKSFEKRSRAYIFPLLGLIQSYISQKKYPKALAVAREFLSLVTQHELSLDQVGDLLDTETPYLSLVISFLERLSLLYNAQYLDTKELKYLEKKQEVLAVAIKLSDRFRIDFNNKEDKLKTLRRTKNLVRKNLNTVWDLEQNTQKQYDYGAMAFNYAERNKSMLLIDLTNNQNAQRMGDLPDSLVEKENSLMKEMDILNKSIAETYDNTGIEKLQQQQSQLGVQINKFKQLLKNKYPKYHQLKYEDITASAAEIQDQLAAGEVVIEYFVADSALYAFCLNQEHTSWTKLNIAKTVLDSQVAKMHKSLSAYQFITNDPDAAYQLYTETAYWFYESILAPIIATQDTKKLQHLIVIADGELGNLPFEVFLTKPAAQKQISYTQLDYLIKKYKVSYNYSATLMKIANNSAPTTNNGKVLALAAEYEKTSKNIPESRLPYLRNFRKALKPLPNAIKEVKEIKKYLEGNFWTGKAATEAQFKKQAGEYAVLHLAMHGLLNKYTPVLSSLAFTEDGDSLEDNFLQAWEISKLQLNADLVVLSACETGYGRFQQGEGILSIARSFMYAGVPSLIVSLWSVNDGSTAIIMQNFYKNLKQKMDKVTALQQAKLSYIQNTKGIGAHPAFWSPFIQVGNHRAVELVQKTSNKYWYIVGGIIGVLGIAYFLRKRRYN